MMAAFRLQYITSFCSTIPTNAKENQPVSKGKQKLINLNQMCFSNVYYLTVWIAHSYMTMGPVSTPLLFYTICAHHTRLHYPLWECATRFMEHCRPSEINSIFIVNCSLSVKTLTKHIMCLINSSLISLTDGHPSAASGAWTFLQRGVYRITTHGDRLSPRVRELLSLLKAV